ncbi:Protein SGT1 [Ceratocystis fimbriata CBS 114723]|uniref:Protein SGT1 n=1 Tax=Ceratocystis fimbriata CBS 114723 TaxID=1035309 RepID=A0A2C5W6A9_9PEZI|nr:Protein SGT1 [Ceratocystis fimbriata CBS 114723]
MSATTLATLGAQALEKRDWPTAIAKYTAAISQTASPLWLINRSKAYVGNQDYTSALADSEAAFHAAVSRSNRKFMAEAQYRRAVALLRLGRYADADCVALWALQLYGPGPASTPDDETTQVDSQGNYTVRKESAAEKIKAAMSGLDKKAVMEVSEVRNRMVAIQAFRQQCLGALERLPESDPSRKPTVSKVPAKNGVVDTQTTPVTTAAPEAAKKGANQTAAKDLRTDFYQSTGQVTLSVFVKGVDKAQFAAQFIPDDDPATSSAVLLNGLPVDGQDGATIKIVLGGPIIIAESSARVSPVKIELSLRKATVVKWNKGLTGAPESVTATEAGATSTVATSDAASTSAPAMAGSTADETRPSYPTSSKKGPVNWDKLTQEEDDDDGKDVNHFFKKLYAGSSDDQRRAMMKSFLESNGTALSTDWSDVKDRTVETKAPDGVDVKQWKP